MALFRCRKVGSTFYIWQLVSGSFCTFRRKVGNSFCTALIGLFYIPRQKAGSGFYACHKVGNRFCWKWAGESVKVRGNELNEN